MRLGILGCGYVANMYRLTLPLQPELTLVGVTDRDADRSCAMAGLTSTRDFGSLEAMLADRSIDLVLNLTNPRSHFETTRACLMAGKHVFTEKPLAISMPDARELVELAERKELCLSSAPCTLLNEGAQTLWKAVREKTVGTVRLVYAEMDDGMVHRMPVQKWVNEAGTPWPYVDEFETGCTMEHAGYVLTWLAAMFGPAETITAFSTCLVEDKVPGRRIETAADFSVACVHFKSGVVARLTCGVYAPVDHTLRIFGDNGVIAIRDPRSDRSPVHIQRYITIRRAMKLAPWRTRYAMVGGRRARARYRGSQQRNFCSGIADMAEAVKQGRACRLSARFCLHVNEMTLAIHHALRHSAPYHMTTTIDPVEPMPWAR